MARESILVVDDNAMNLKLSRVFLVSEGYTVKTASNAEEAFKVLTNFTPRLILMDIQLPLLDGYEATRRIKADPALKHIPIIVVTSYALGGDEAKARAAGCDAYMAKPYSPKALLAKVREYAR